VRQSCEPVDQLVYLLWILIAHTRLNGHFQSAELSKKPARRVRDSVAAATYPPPSKELELELEGS